MKKLTKDTINYFMIKGRQIFVKFYYRLKIRKELKKSDNQIDQQYKQEIKKYWNEFGINICTDWHKWYASVNCLKDVRYIPEDVFYSKIEPYYNRLDFSKAYSDKALYDEWFSDVKRPVTVVRNMSGLNYDVDSIPISPDEVISLCRKKTAIIVKPSIESGGGRNIVFINAENPTVMEEKIKHVLHSFQKDFVIQEIVEQHEALKALNPTSVNTVRMLTFLHNNSVSVLSSHIRIGEVEAEHDHYGYVSGIKENGYLQHFARETKVGTIIEKHPLGYEFREMMIPSYEVMKSIAMKCHIKFGHFKLISWDFAVDKKGEPVLIEFNLKWQGINNHQLTTGPIFGDLTKDVLTEVLGRG